MKTYLHISVFPSILQIVDYLGIAIDHVLREASYVQQDCTSYACPLVMALLADAVLPFQRRCWSRYNFSTTQECNL